MSAGLCIIVLRLFFWEKKGYNLKKIITRMYFIALALFLFLIIYGSLNLRITVDRENQLNDFSYVTRFVTNTVPDETAPLKHYYDVEFTIRDIVDDNNTICFYTVHQNVQVFLDGEEIYRLQPVKKLFLPRTPGRVYNFLEFEPEDNGKRLTVRIIPVYYGRERIPDILIGSRYAIVKSIKDSNFGTIFLGVLTIIMAVFLLFFKQLNGDESTDDKTAVHLLGFAINISIWKLTDSSIIGLWGANVPILALIPYAALTLIPVQAVHFISSMVRVRRVKAWDISRYSSIISLLMVLLFQLTGVTDFGESLWILQLNLVICVVCLFVGLHQVSSKQGMTDNIRMSLAYSGCCALWMVVDIVGYYLAQSEATFSLSMMIFMIFMIVLAVDRVRKSKVLMQAGSQARQYKKLAYHDALTGFFNRAAYTDHLAAADFRPDKVIVVMFDLNNLKKCNDTFGHEKGDIYIKESARIIMDCFGENGRCYRMGGDEFAVIMNTDSVEACKKAVGRMRDRVDRFNDASRDIHMGIAYGFSAFDPAEDTDVHDMIRRADKMMYENKFQMKREER